VFPRWHFEKFDGSQDIFLHPQNSTERTIPKTNSVMEETSAGQVNIISSALTSNNPPQEVRSDS
jgi:hypothetical protein